MIYTTRIPCKAKKITFTDNSFIEIDTNGLDCTLKAVDTDITVKVYPNDTEENVFLLSAGERLDFSGKIFVSGTKDACAYTLMYTTF